MSMRADRHASAWHVGLLLHPVEQMAQMVQVHRSAARRTRRPGSRRAGALQQVTEGLVAEGGGCGRDGPSRRAGAGGGRRPRARSSAAYPDTLRERVYRGRGRRQRNGATNRGLRTTGVGAYHFLLGHSEVIVDGRIHTRPHGRPRPRRAGASHGRRRTGRRRRAPGRQGAAVTPQEHGLAFFLPRARILLAFIRNHKKTHLRNR